MRKGSDGFQKCFQIDEQHLEDIEEERESGIQKNEQAKKKLLQRWKAGKDFLQSVCKKKVWDSHGVLDARKINGTEAAQLIRFFAINGFSNKSKETKIKKVMDTCCTKLSFSATKAELAVLMRENGIEQEWDEDSISDNESLDNSKGEEVIEEEIEEEEIDEDVMYGMSIVFIFACSFLQFTNIKNIFLLQ